MITTTDLAARWAALRAEDPKLRIRNAADALGTTELELVETMTATASGDGALPDDHPGTATRLSDDWKTMLAEVERFGEVMALTRNASCVHERTGRYAPVDFNLPHNMGLVLDPEIDLRLFFRAWSYGFAVETPSGAAKDGVRRSLQFFDAHGGAVHKIFLTRKSDASAYTAFVEKHRATAAEPVAVTPRPAPKPDAPDSEIDGEGFREAWSKLKDTHDFFPLIRKFGVGRVQALRLVEGTYTRRVGLDAPRRILDAASESGLPIMAFVGSPGCIQIHSGPVNTVKEYGPWYNVLDPRFNLHLKEGDVAEAWVVTKPTEDGDVTALEVFDAAGEMIVQFFGARKPGVPELPEWRALCASL